MNAAILGRLLLPAILVGCLATGQSQARADGGVDQCPDMDDHQTIDVCVPPSIPKAKILKTCVTKQEGKVKVRLKNKGDYWTEAFWITGAGANKQVIVKPGKSKVRWVHNLVPGEVLYVTAHGVVYASTLVEGPRCS